MFLGLIGSSVNITITAQPDIRNTFFPDFCHLTLNLPGPFRPLSIAARYFQNIPAHNKFACNQYRRYPQADLIKQNDPAATITQNTSLETTNKPDATFDQVCANAPIFDQIKNKGFITAVLWDEIMTPHNICNYTAPWGSYKKLSLNLEKLQPYKKETQDHIYDILFYYNKHDANSSTEQSIKKNAVAIIYDKVLDAFEHKIGIDPLELDAKKLVQSCPRSTYVLDAFTRKYKQKEKQYCTDVTAEQQELCKKIREKLQEFEAERSKHQNPTHQA